MLTEVVNPPVFRDRMRRARKARSLSMDDLAARLKVHLNWIWKLENGIKVPGPRCTVTDIALALRVEPAWLAGPPRPPLPIPPTKKDTP